MYIISLSCIIYKYCKLILKSPSGRINKKVIFVLHRFNGSFGCYADVFEEGSSITANPGLGILFITSFTVLET